jgi:hypothetical protein
MYLKTTLGQAAVSTSTASLVGRDRWLIRLDEGLNRLIDDRDGRLLLTVVFSLNELLRQRLPTRNKGLSLNRGLGLDRVRGAKWSADKGGFYFSREPLRRKANC